MNPTTTRYTYYGIPVTPHFETKARAYGKVTIDVTFHDEGKDVRAKVNFDNLRSTSLPAGVRAVDYLEQAPGSDANNLWNAVIKRKQRQTGEFYVTFPFAGNYTPTHEASYFHYFTVEG